MVILFNGCLNHARSMVRGSLSRLDEAALVFRPENCVIGIVQSIPNALGLEIPLRKSFSCSINAWKHHTEGYLALP